MEKRANFDSKEKEKSPLDDSVQAKLRSIDEQGDDSQRRERPDGKLEKQSLATRVFVGNLSFRTTWNI